MYDNMAKMADSRGIKGRGVLKKFDMSFTKNRK